MKKRLSLVITIALVLVSIIFFGTWFFSVSEGWTLIESFYFVVMTITTVGYGDFVPTSDISMIVTSIYSLITIPLVLVVFGLVAESYFENKIESLERRLRSVLVKEEQIEEAIEATEEKIEEDVEKSIEHDLAFKKWPKEEK